ncbi:MAG: hypothetical protein AAF821_12785 [Cyanobacteria bacterium P01_D01_bin.156]
MAEPTLTKAKLVPRTGAPTELVFMFNPKELSFVNKVNTVDNPGARSEVSGRPWVSFSDLPPKELIIKDIWFDTYETGKDVITTYLQNFIDAVTFTKNKDNEQHPPTYLFQWGPHNDYLAECFIAQLNYRLTKFMPDGTPVRAVIETLGLKEAEKPSDRADQQRETSPNPTGDNRQTRS